MSAPNQPLRVALLGMGWLDEEPGGLNRFLHDLLFAIRALDVDARAVVTGSAPDDPWVVGAEARTGSLIRRIVRFSAAARGLGDVDVVDAHFALYALLPVLTHFRRTPLVSHFQGPWADECVAAGDLSTIRHVVRRCLERAVLRRARVVVTLSEAFKQLVVERYGVLPWDVRVVPPLVDLQRFGPRPQDAARSAIGLAQEAWIVACVRRLTPRMGLDVLIEAWARVIALDSNAILVIAGEGPERPGLEKVISRLGIQSHVRLLGRVPDDRLLDVYAAADICIAPTVALEGFGLVVAEALACGKATLVTNVGGLPEALGSASAGLVVSADDVGELAAGLEAIRSGQISLPNAEECQRLAARFEPRTAAIRTIEVYREAIEGPQGPRRPRVVYLDHCAKLSGAELALLRVLPALSVDAHVILGEDGPLVARLRREGCSVEVFPLPVRVSEVRRGDVRPGRLSLGTFFAAAVYTVRLALRLRRLDPDLVHTNSLKAMLYGTVAARLARKPVVAHVRDRIASDYLPSAAVRLVRRIAVRGPDALIANSIATNASLPSNASARIIASPVIYDSVMIHDGATRHNEPWLTVGLIGRIAPWKGQDIFLRAFAKAFPCDNTRAVIIGAPMFGEDEYERSLCSLVDELGVGSRVQFRGFREQIHPELAQIDILVHASTIPEPFGQVVVEGMAAGLPVVVPAAGGPAEIVEDGQTGLLYPMGDVEALAQQLARLAYDADLRRELGSRARARVKSFTPAEIAVQIEEVYAAVLARAAT